MIAQISVDSRALSEPSDVGDRLDAHARLTREFLRFAALRLLGPEDETELRIQFHADPEVGEMWKRLFKDLGDVNRLLRDPAHMRSETMREWCDRGELPEDIRDLVDLVVASERAEWNHPGDGLPELATAKRFDLSHTLHRIRELADEMTYEKGTPRDVIWKERWAPLARLSTEVNICDPYLFGEKAFDPKKRDRIRHVTWLLDRLHDVLPGGATVRLFTARGSYDMKDVGDHLSRSRFCRERPGALHIFIWKERNRRRSQERTESSEEDLIWGPHDRHIRFSCGVATDVPAGFDKLRNPQIVAEQGYKCHFIGPGKTLNILTDVEVDVAKHAQHWVYQEQGLVPCGGSSPW